MEQINIKSVLLGLLAGGIIAGGAFGLSAKDNITFCNALNECFEFSTDQEYLDVAASLMDTHSKTKLTGAEASLLAEIYEYETQKRYGMSLVEYLGTYGWGKASFDNLNAIIKGEDIPALD